MPPFSAALAAAPVRYGLAAMGLCGAAASASYVYDNYIKEKPPRDEDLVRFAAIALSGVMVERTLHDAEVLQDLATFGLKALAHPTTVAALKKLYLELIDDRETLDPLHKFVVRQVIQDPWVFEELMDTVYTIKDVLLDDDAVYPSGVLSWLGDGSWEGLQDPSFQEKLRSVLVSAAFEAALGPPPRSVA